LEGLNVFDVLRKGFELYKDNFSKLFKASLLYVLVLLISSIISFLDAIFGIGVISFVNLFISLASIYFSIRLLISITILARDIVKSDESELVCAYEEAKKYFWRYISNTLLVTIPVVIPVHFAKTLQKTQIPFMHIFPQYIVIAIVVGIISCYLHFAPLSVALEPNLTRRLRYSSKLVKGRLIKVFSILIFSSYVFSAPLSIFNYFAPLQFKSPYFVFTLNIIMEFIYLFSTPFTACVGAILFYKLQELKNINKR
jgi:hypothetical protein